MPAHACSCLLMPAHACSCLLMPAPTRKWGKPGPARSPSESSPFCRSPRDLPFVRPSVLPSPEARKPAFMHGKSILRKCSDFSRRRKKLALLPSRQLTQPSEKAMLVTLPKISVQLGISVYMLQKMVKTGQFPKPYIDSPKPQWRAADVDAWFESWKRK